VNPPAATPAGVGFGPRPRRSRLLVILRTFSSFSRRLKSKGTVRFGSRSPQQQTNLGPSRRESQPCRRCRFEQCLTARSKDHTWRAIQRRLSMSTENTKLAGEVFIKGTAEKYFIVRTSALYGSNPCRAKGGRNFVDLMLKLAGERDELRVVDDEVISPTSTAELAKQITELSRADQYGLYHATAEGSCSWYEFARTIFEITNTRVSLKIAAPNEFPARVPRPKYSVLENQGLKKLGLNFLASWQEGLTSLATLDPALRGNLIPENFQDRVRVGIRNSLPCAGMRGSVAHTAKCYKVILESAPE